jgi:ubiquinone/menaquinone biosynthesis C-methylase UbiE
MNKFFDPAHLREDQYKTTQNLDARVTLHRRFSTNPYPWQKWVFDQLKFPLEAEILEVGCGPAYLWVENKSRTPSGWNLTLTDISHGMATAAGANLGGSKDIALLSTSAQSLAFSSQAFDGVIANHMLYHVPNMETAIREIRRVLKPNGLFYSTTNGFRH